MSRGKRGNIVQVYPATEYFFAPEGALVGSQTYQEGVFLHFHSAGSNTNPNNNDGQGKRGTDRTNLCPMTDDVYGGAAADPASYRVHCTGTVACSGNPGTSYAKRLTNDPYTSLGWTGPQQNLYRNARSVFEAGKSGLAASTWRELCMLRQAHNPDQDYGNMEELDDSAADWSIPVVKGSGARAANGAATEVRTAYLCTRNNNFSNRSQKGALVFSAQTSTQYVVASMVGGVFELPTGIGGLVIVPPGMTTGAMPVAFSSNEEQCSMTLDFDSTQLASNGWVQLMIPCEPQALHKPQIMKKNGGSWDTASTSPKKGFRNGKYMTVVSVSAPGTYQVTYVLDGLAVAAVVTGGVLFCVAFTVACFLRGRK
jgi:hypothetical protein